MSCPLALEAAAEVLVRSLVRDFIERIPVWSDVERAPCYRSQIQLIPSDEPGEVPF